MEEFVAGLSKEARKELLDYLHDCRHRCRTAHRAELHASLSKLVALLEKAMPRERRASGLLKLVKTVTERHALEASAEKRPTAPKKVPPGD